MLVQQQWQSQELLRCAAPWVRNQRRRGVWQCRQGALIIGIGYSGGYNTLQKNVEEKVLLIIPTPTEAGGGPRSRPGKQLWAGSSYG